MDNDESGGQSGPPETTHVDVSVLSAENGEKLFTSCANDPISLRPAPEAFGGLRYSSADRPEKSDMSMFLAATKSTRPSPFLPRMAVPLCPPYASLPKEF